MDFFLWKLQVENLHILHQSNEILHIFVELFICFPQKFYNYLSEGGTCKKAQFLDIVRNVRTKMSVQNQASKNSARLGPVLAGMESSTSGSSSESLAERFGFCSLLPRQRS